MYPPSSPFCAGKGRPIRAAIDHAACILLTNESLILRCEPDNRRLLKVKSSAVARPRWERRKEERPAQLLAAALDLFVERGFAGTRLDDVAARAGVSKGTLYLYFDTKEALFKAVVRDNIVALIARARDEASAFDGSTANLLRRLVTTWWTEFASTTAGGITKLMVAESGNFPEITRFFLDEVIEPWRRVLCEVIQRGIERGEFRPVDVESFVDVMKAPMVMLALWTRSFGPCSAQPMDPERYIAAMLDLVLTALAKPVVTAAATSALRRKAGGRRAARMASR